MSKNEKEKALKSFAELGTKETAEKLFGQEKNAVQVVVETPVSADQEEAVVVVAMPSAAEIKKIGLELDVEMWAELRKKAQDEKEAADAVGRKLHEIRKKIHQVESDLSLKGTSIGETILAALRKDVVRLKSYGDEHFQKRAEGFALVEEIREIDPTHIEKVREIYARVISLGHRRLVPKKEIDEAQMAKRRLDGLIFFEGKATISAFQGEEKNSFYRALEAELRKLTDKAKTSKAAIIAAVSPDLTGYGHGKPGAYQFVSPYHKDGDGREYFEGRAIVKLFDINKDRGSRPYVKVEITKATGSLGWAENQPGKRPIPLDWIRNGEIPPDKEKEITPDQVKYAKKTIFNLRRIYGNWKKGLNPEAAKPKEEKPEGPVFTIPDVDMTDVVVERGQSLSLEKVLESVSPVSISPVVLIGKSEKNGKPEKTTKRAKKA